jgi:hypothetical protein
MACSLTIFVWNFTVYCGEEKEVKMWHGVQEKGHVTSIENFFTSVELLYRLALRQIYAIGIVRTNRIGLHLIFKNAAAFNNAS